MGLRIQKSYISSKGLVKLYETHYSMYDPSACALTHALDEGLKYF